MQKVRDSKAFCYAVFVRCAKKWGESYINYGEKYLAPGRILWHNWGTAAVRDAMMWHIRPAHMAIYPQGLAEGLDKFGVLPGFLPPDAMVQMGGVKPEAQPGP